MPTFLIPNMSCGHCVAAITVAVKEVDAGAVVAADLERHEVRIDGAAADTAALAAAITAAGYTPALKPS